MVLTMYRAVNAAVALSLGLLIVCGGFSPITRFLTAIVAAKFAINAVFGIDEQWFRQPSPNDRDYRVCARGEPKGIS